VRVVATLGLLEVIVKLTGDGGVPDRVIVSCPEPDSPIMVKLLGVMVAVIPTVTLETALA
jgi:hypothetical protein